MNQGCVFGRPTAGLVQALAIQTERGLGRSKPLGCLLQLDRGNATHFLHPFRSAGHDFLDQGCKTFGVLLNVVLICPRVLQHDAQHAVKQHHVGAGLQRQVQIGGAGRIGFARVGHNDFEVWIFGPSIFNAPEQNGMRVGCVAARNEQAVSFCNVLVAGGWGICAQG